MSNLMSKISKDKLVELIRIRTQNNSPVKKQRWREPKKRQLTLNTKVRFFSEKPKTMAELNQSEVEEWAATHQQMIERFSGIVDKAKNERFQGFVSPKRLNEALERCRWANKNNANVSCLQFIRIILQQIFYS